MILYAIALFALAAVFGLSMIFLGIRYRRGSLVLGLGHAGIATLGLVVLIVAIFKAQFRPLIYNDVAILLVMTLAGGIVLLALREGRKPPPMVVVGVHAAMALFSIFLLVIGYMHN